MVYLVVSVVVNDVVNALKKLASIWMRTLLNSGCMDISADIRSYTCSVSMYAHLTPMREVIGTKKPSYVISGLIRAQCMISCVNNDIGCVANFYIYKLCDVCDSTRWYI